MWFDNPVKLGERVTYSGAYTDAYVRRGQGYVVMDAKAVGEDGRTIVRHRGVEIFRTVPGEIGGRASSAPDRKVAGEAPGDARQIETVGENVRAGDVIARMRKVITAEQAAVFSRIGEFVRNTHDDLDVARAGKLPTLIVQGQQQAGLVGEFFARTFGTAWFTNGWFKLKFINMLQVFDPLEISAIVTQVTQTAEGLRKVELDIWTRRESDGKLTTVGWASCVI